MTPVISKNSCISRFQAQQTWIQQLLRHATSKIPQILNTAMLTTARSSYCQVGACMVHKPTKPPNALGRFIFDLMSGFLTKGAAQEA